jgi:hypothetical protein
MELKHYLNSINYDKKALMDNDEKAEKLYPPYVVNRCFSFFSDTIFHANVANCNWTLDKKMQFDFYRLSIRKNKRFSPWVKKEESADIDLLKHAYGYTEQKAREVLNILRPEDLQQIRKFLDTGGTK